MPFTEFPIPSVELSTVAADARTAIDAMQNTNAAVNAAIAEDPGETKSALGVPYLSVKDYGALGNGSNDDTAEIQTCINAAQAINAAVYFPDGNYLISADLVISQSGTRLFGQNAEFTKITQTSNSEHGITISLGGDAHAWGAQTRRVTIERIGIFSTGAALSTGRGVNIPGDSVLTAQVVVLREVTLRGWGTGFYNRRGDQTSLLDCVVAYNNVGIDYNTSTHSLQLHNTGIARSTTCGIIAGAASGNVIIGGDFGNQPLDIQVYGPQPLTLIGSNHESNLGGTECIRIENNAQLTCIGAYFLKGSGLDVPRFRLVGTSALNIQSHLDSGDYTTSYVVRDNSASVVTGITNGASLTTHARAEATTGEKYVVQPWPAVLSSAGVATTATANTANQLYTVLNTTLGGASSLVWHGPGNNVVHTLSGRASSGGNTDLTSVTGLNLGSVSNPPIRSTSGGSTTGLYFSTNQVGLTASGASQILASSSGLTIRGGPLLTSGTGSPQSVVTAPVGSMYLRTDGSTGTTFYIKETGTGNTGWVEK